MTVVTISASYGAGGSEIGPHVASALGVPFIDRVISAEVARQLGISVEEAEAVAQDVPNRFWGLIAGMAGGVPGFMAMSGPNDQVSSERQLFESTEAEIRRVAAAGSCVILGRAAAVVLADRPNALHVRLDGAPEGRMRAALRQHGVSPADAKDALKRNDRLRSGYVEHFYGKNSGDPRLYHLVIDTTRLAWDVVEQIVVAAARAHQSHPAPAAGVNGAAEARPGQPA